MPNTHAPNLLARSPGEDTNGHRPDPSPAATWTARATGKSIRLARIFSAADGRALVVPLDHSVSDGPLAVSTGLAGLVTDLAPAADAIVLHKGTIRTLPPACFRDTQLIAHISASTRHANDTDAKYLVASVDSMVRLGADAISVHVNLGSDTESTQIQALADVSDECEQSGIPLLAMVYPRGPRLSDPSAPELVAHAASLAADLGADIVKVPLSRDLSAMRDIAASCPIPILVAGGVPRREIAAVADYVSSVASTGVAGLAMGRTIFTSSSPGHLAATVKTTLHATPPMRRASLAPPDVLQPMIETDDRTQRPTQ